MKKILFKIISVFLNFHQTFIYNSFRRKYDIDPSFRFNGKDILFYGDGQIICEEDSYVGEYSTWQAVSGASIRIGRGCSISHNVRCYTSSNMPDNDFEIKPIPEKIGNVVIGNYVWIGANVFINPGVTIGNNSVVGANSVIVKDIPPFSIWGGVPAKLIRMKNIQ